MTADARVDQVAWPVDVRPEWVQTDQAEQAPDHGTMSGHRLVPGSSGFAFGLNDPSFHRVDFAECLVDGSVVAAFAEVDEAGAGCGEDADGW